MAVRSPDQASVYATKPMTERVEDKTADRERIASEVAAFLAAGNRIAKVPMGLTGKDHSPRGRRDTFVINAKKAAEKAK